MAKDRAKAEKDAGPLAPGKCNAIRKTGKRCRQRAGEGTPHPGIGPCKECTGSTPTVARRYAREEALTQARVWLDSEEDMDPLEAALINVRIASNVVRYQQAKMRTLEAPTREDERALEDALQMCQRVTDIALRAGIAERLVNIAERAGDQLAFIFETALAAAIKAGAEINDIQRTAFARSVEQTTTRLEDEPALRLLPPGEAA